VVYAACLNIVKYWPQSPEPAEIVRTVDFHIEAARLGTVAGKDTSAANLELVAVAFAELLGQVEIDKIDSLTETFLQHAKKEILAH
jgi:hypothetical protein